MFVCIGWEILRRRGSFGLGFGIFVLLESPMVDYTEVNQTKVVLMAGIDTPC